METLHYTYQLADHAHGMTFCGITITTDHTATRHAKQGPWVTCPLCELRRTLIDAGLEPQQRSLTPARWIQPTLEGAAQWA